jgi:hypothetical protein
MTGIESLEKEVEKIKARNRKVEGDKAWETSWVRRISVAVATYIVVATLFYMLKIDKPFLAAFVPTEAYIVSTFSLGLLKTWWLKKRK